jgi:hypothetical protein
MPTLVDGHNALHRLGLDTGTHEGDRRALLRRVRAIDPGAVVYFDARHAPPGLPTTSREEGVAVRYCRGEEADDAILRVVRNRDRPETLTVVTDDSEVSGVSRQLGAKTASVRRWFGGRRPGREPPGATDRTGPAGFTPGDFGLPSEIDLDDPGGDVKP